MELLRLIHEITKEKGAPDPRGSKGPTEVSWYASLEDVAPRTGGLTQGSFDILTDILWKQGCLQKTKSPPVYLPTVGGLNILEHYK